MEPSGLRHYRSSSSGGDRFLSLFSFSPPPSAVAGGGSGELEEAEVCFDFSDPVNMKSLSSAEFTTNSRRQFPARQLQKSGLLAALPAATASKQIPTSRTANRERDLAQTAPCRKFQQSAPVKVPIMTPAALASRRKSSYLEDDDDEVDDEMLPPHEIVARRESSVWSTCSVLEGAGRTLKGRDLRQVRNAIWRRTGFLD